MQHCEPTKTPVEVNLEIDKAKDEPDDVTFYRSVVCSLLYVAQQQTRPGTIRIVKVFSLFKNSQMKLLGCKQTGAPIFRCNQSPKIKIFIRQRLQLAS